MTKAAAKASSRTLDPSIPLRQQNQQHRIRQRELGICSVPRPGSIQILTPSLTR